MRAFLRVEADVPTGPEVHLQDEGDVAVAGDGGGDVDDPNGEGWQVDLRVQRTADRGGSVVGGEGGFSPIGVGAVQFQDGRRDLAGDAGDGGGEAGAALCARRRDSLLKRVVFSERAPWVGVEARVTGAGGGAMERIGCAVKRSVPRRGVRTARVKVRASSSAGATIGSESATRTSKRRSRRRWGAGDGAVAGEVESVGEREPASSDPLSGPSPAVAATGVKEGRPAMATGSEIVTMEDVRSTTVTLSGGDSGVSSSRSVAAAVRE